MNWVSTSEDIEERRIDDLMMAGRFQQEQFHYSTAPRGPTNRSTPASYHCGVLSKESMAQEKQLKRSIKMRLITGNYDSVHLPGVIVPLTPKLKNVWRKNRRINAVVSLGRQSTEIRRKNRCIRTAG
jgi:hypothetical protein